MSPKFDRAFVYNDLQRHIGEELFSSLSDCIDLCYDAHDGQFRDPPPGSKQKVPYILHPVGVAKLAFDYFDLVSLPHDLETVLKISLAHDVLEDTKCDAAGLSLICGNEVTRIVALLTKPPFEKTEASLDRNKRFLEQIVRGGPTAMFVKICDSMHNLSRPHHAPPKLMAKAIRKAKSDYINFFYNGLCSDALEQIYKEHIQRTERQFETLPRISNNQLPQTLADVLKTADLRVQNKVLEQHDIVDFFRNCQGTKLVDILPRKQIVKCLNLPSNVKPEEAGNFLFGFINSGQLLVEKVPKSWRSAPMIQGIDAIFFVPIDIGKQEYDKDGTYLVVTKLPGESSEWITFEALRVISSFLAERVRENERKEYYDLSVTAGHLNITATPEQLQKAKFNYPRLLELNKAYRSARLAIKQLQLDLDTAFQLTKDMSNFQIQTRIKEPSSVMNKMVRRSIYRIQDLDDFVGIRVVCATPNEVVMVTNICEELVRRWHDEKSSYEPSFHSVTNDAGYRAKHISFTFLPIFDQLVPVQCEIQVRTILEDAWARLSDSIGNKNASEKSKSSKIMKAVSKELEIVEREAAKKLNGAK